MRTSAKSQHIPQVSKLEGERVNNHGNNTKTQFSQKINLVVRKTIKKQQVNGMSLSRKMYILTDHQDQILQSIPTAKHTFMSEQAYLTGERLEGFYSSKNKDQKLQDKHNGNKQHISKKEPDMKSDFVNSKSAAMKKEKRSRFYYKAEEYEFLDQVKVQSKPIPTKQANEIPSGINSSGALNLTQKDIKVMKPDPPKDKIIEQEQTKQKSPKQNDQDAKQEKQQTLQNNSKVLQNYISKINRSSKSPCKPLEEQTQKPHSSRFSHQRSNSPLQQSHQKLFNKCYKQTYAHLKLMLREIHSSQEQMHIIHKQISDTLFQVIKERAQAIRKQMNQLVDSIVSQWMKDQWQFAKNSEIEFMDDILEIEYQLHQREKEIHSFLDQLIKENQNNEEKINEKNSVDDILQTFNAKSNIKNATKSTRTQTTWKKVTTDLLMFNYENNIIEIQDMIEKISSNSLQKCNKAVDMLPSSEVFDVNSHFEVFNPRAKKWFKQAVLTFMNEATEKPESTSLRERVKQFSPKKTFQKTFQLKNKSNKKSLSKQYKEYQQIIQSIKFHKQKSSSPKNNSSRQHKQEDYYNYTDEQDFLAKQLFKDKVQTRKQQESNSPSKLYLDRAYYARGRSGNSYS